MDRRPARAVYQVSVDERKPTASPETETLENILRRLLPTPALQPPQADPIPTDQDLLIQRLMGTICPPKPVAQERSAVMALEAMLLNWLPVGTVTEEKAVSPSPTTVSAEGCFSCGSDLCVVSDSMPTAVSVRTVVTEEWMDRFVIDLVECPSVSRCGGPDVRAGRV